VRLKDTFVVESGLASDERFVTEGVQRIKDGALITTRPEPARASPTM
jgi:hypothetical protein